MVRHDNATRRTRERTLSSVSERDQGREPARSSNLAGDVDVSDIFDVIYRRKWLIVSAVTVSILATVLVLSQLVPRYTATAQLIIDARRVSIPTLESVVPGLNGDNQTVISEVEVLRSRRLASSVVDQMQLTDDPEFNSRLRPPGWLDRLTGRFKRRLPEESEDREKARVVTAFLQHVRVSPVPDSRVISVSVTSHSPESSAQIANALVDEYVNSQQQAKRATTGQVDTFLASRIDSLRGELSATETKIERFRSDANLLETHGTTITAQQLADLNSQLVKARTDRAEVSARLEQLNRLIEAPEQGGIFTATEVLDSPLIQELRQQQVTVNRRIAELSSELGEAHPTMVQLRADAADLAAQIDTEVEKIAQGLRNEMAIAQARERTLESELNELSDEMSKKNEDQIHLRALEREAEVDRGLLATLLAKQKEIETQDQFDYQQADSRVISYADPPITPSFPQKGFALGIVTLMSMLVALAVVFVLELRKKGFASSEQLEAITGIQSFGMIPRIGYFGNKQSLVDEIVLAPQSALAQSLWTLNWQLSNALRKPNQVIVVTSATSGEGKSTTAGGLARTKAFAGAKTLLLDADTRKPTIHTAFGIAQGPGLIEVLEGSCNSADAVVADPKSSLDILPAGKACMNPLALLDSQQMKELLRLLGRKYDCVIIDTPPALVVPDACALGREATATLFVVRWSLTPPSIVEQTLTQLERSGAHVIGASLTMFDTKVYSKYGYGYYGPRAAYDETQEDARAGAA